MLRLLSAVFMGWALGSNDSANVFGTAVFSRMIRYSTAVILTAVFIIAGAVLEGADGLKTLGSITESTAESALAASLAASITVAVMSILKLPVSTSQAVVGAILGTSILIGKVDLSQFFKVVICWLTTPVGAVVISAFLYPFLGRLIETMNVNIFTRDSLVRAGLIAAGCYGSYALGANNVANVTGVFAGAGLLSAFEAALYGGLFIALGALTYSKNVMITVGRNLVRLDSFSAFVSVLSMSIVLHIYAKFGVPVSSSQAIIGAILGVGLLKGMQTINLKTLKAIVFGWLATPLIAAAFAFLIMLV
jgi:PiT family inorganic phosphate transporter